MTEVIFKRSTSIPATLAKGEIEFVDNGGSNATMFIGNNSNQPVQVIGDQLPAGSTAWLYVGDYGAVGDGTTDDSSAIQDCIDAAQLAKKAVMFAPGKTYVISAGLTAKAGNDGNTQWDLTIIGNGAKIKPTSTVNALSLVSQCLLADKATGKGVAIVNISDLTFDGANGASGNALMIGRSGYFFDGFLRSTINNVMVYNYTSASAVWFYNARQFHITNLVMRATRLKAHCDATNNFAGDLYFSGCDFEGFLCSPTAGECRGIHFDHCNFYQTLASDSVVIQPSGTAVVGDVWFDGCQWDSYINGNPPIVLNAVSASSRVFQIYISNNYFTGFHEQFIYTYSATAGNVYMIQVTDNIVQSFTISPANDLLSINRAHNVSVNNNQFENITVTGADQLARFNTCQNVSFSGNVSRLTSGYWHGGNFQSCTNVIATGNGMDVGNSSVVYNDTSTNVLFANNAQW